MRWEDHCKCLTEYKEQQETGQSGLGKASKTSTIQRGVQATKECKKQEKLFSQGKSTQISGYPISNAHPWKQTYK